ncbi:hypothetical protein LCGC14_1112090 [marine sediment metagenome]|uniref:DNA N-6-adenine-methyltransferase (Dam) n=1 Tax=marine sediment metagenome TaxID=412755 RepID=A0A0F9MB72_9ZZZZ
MEVIPLGTGVTQQSRAYMLPSKKTEYETPRDLFDRLWDDWDGFDLDPCCQRWQYTAAKVLGSGGQIFIPPNAPDPMLPPLPVHDPHIERVHRGGLDRPWYGKVFMNPPYGREIGKWLAKAVHEVEENRAIVVALLPAKTGPKWWQEYVMTEGDEFGILGEADHVQFLPGRLKFEGEKASAPFDSAIVIWQK